MPNPLWHKAIRKVEFQVVASVSVSVVQGTTGSDSLRRDQLGDILSTTASESNDQAERL